MVSLVRNQVITYLRNLVVTFSGMSIMYTNTDIDSDFLDIMVLGLVVVAWLQPARVYYQAVRKEYTAGAFLLHVLQWYANLAFLLFLVLLVIALFTGKSRIHLN